MKPCSKCGIEKPLTEFHKNRRSKSGDGHSYYCKECDRAAHRQAWGRHKEKYKARQRAAYAEQMELFGTRKAKCNCRKYQTCFVCRNAERRRAFKAGEVPVYRMEMLAALVGERG